MEKRGREGAEIVASIAVIGTAVVFLWRGTWALMDLGLFPNSSLRSAWASLGISIVGMILGLLLHATLPRSFTLPSAGGSHSPCHVACLHTISRLCLLFWFVTTLFFWRGVWMLQDEYILRKDPFLSALLSVIVALCVLIPCNALASGLAPPMGFANDDPGVVERELGPETQTDPVTVTVGPETESEPAEVTPPETESEPAQVTPAPDVMTIRLGPAFFPFGAHWSYSRLPWLNARNTT